MSLVKQTEVCVCGRRLGRLLVFTVRTVKQFGFQADASELWTNQM